MIESLTIAILSGKGGVGKSSIAINLALAFSQAKNKSLIMDCDLGLANLDVLLGIAPEKNIQELFAAGANADPQDYVYPVPELDFDLLPASSGIPESDEMTDEIAANIFKTLEPLFAGYNTVLLDLGAGIHGTVQHFAKYATMRVIVISPEPTSLTDAYALIKVLYTKHKIKDFFVLVNQVENKREEEQSYKRLAKVCEHFLGFSPIFLGSVRSDEKISESIRKQRPILQIFPKSKAACDMQVIADKILLLKEKMTQ